MKIIIGLMISSLFILSCKKETVEEPKMPEPTPISAKFATDVQPIFQTNCGTGGSCHGTINAERGYVFETHLGASAVSNAKILGTINHQSGFSNMPRVGPKLSDAKIAIIEAWIDGGKLND